MDFDAPEDTHVPHEDGEQTDTSARSKGLRIWLLFLLLLVLPFTVLLSLFGTGVGITTPSSTATPGQCDFAAKAFNTRQEAFALAQQVEQYRKANPTARNYGMGSYTICYKNGTQQRYPSPIAPGYTQTEPPTNATHSEQVVYQWLLKQFQGLALDSSTIVGFYTVIFSQVTVCDQCISDMVSWQKGLRQAARTDKVALSIWDIQRGKGFVPTQQPAGNGTPIAPQNLRKVPIVFAS